MEHEINVTNFQSTEIKDEIILWLGQAFYEKIEKSSSEFNFSALNTHLDNIARIEKEHRESVRVNLVGGPAVFEVYDYRAIY